MRSGLLIYPVFQALTDSDRRLDLSDLPRQELQRGCDSERERSHVMVTSRLDQTSEYVTKDFACLCMVATVINFIDVRASPPSAEFSWDLSSKDVSCLVKSKLLKERFMKWPCIVGG